MDLLYKKYSNPLEFMNLYINQGRFGEFVENIITQDRKQKQEAIKKENEDRMWEAYIHSYSDKSFNDWKNSLTTSSEKESAKSLSMTADEVNDVKNKSRNILKGFKL